MEKQVVVCPDMRDRDVMGLAWDKGKAVVTVMMVRSGLLIDTVHYPLDLGFKEPDEVLAGFVDQYYGKTRFLPVSVLLSQRIENSGEIEDRLTQTSDGPFSGTGREKTLGEHGSGQCIPGT